MPTRIVGVGAQAVAGATITPDLPVGWQEGDLFYLPIVTSVLSATLGTAPAGWTVIDDSMVGTEGCAVLARIATASESAPTVQPWSTGALAGQITALRPDSGKAFPAIGSAVAGKTISTPGTSADGRYAAHNIISTGNVLIRSCFKNSNLVGTPTAVALTSGYTACGFINRTTNCMVSSEMLTTTTTVGDNQASVDPVVTGLSTNSNRASVAFEFIQTSSMSITTDESTYVASTDSAQVLIEVTRNTSFPSSPTATLAGVALVQDSYSGSVASFIVPLTSDFNLGEDFASVGWETNLTLEVTDSGGSATATIQILPPVDDHWAQLAGGAFDYAPATSANDDYCYVDILSGDGVGAPEIAGHFGNTVPTTVAFRVFKSGAWLDAEIRTFDIAAGTYDGEIADQFNDTDGVNLSAHTPDADIVGSGWVHERDVSSAAVPSGDLINIVSNRLVITGVNQGGTIDAGTVNPDFTVVWRCTSDDNRWSMHARRVDDENHITMFVRKEGLVTLNQRVGGTGVGLQGEVSYQHDFPFQENTDYAFRLLLEGQNVYAYLDDVLIMTATTELSPPSNATKIGIYSAGASYLGSGVLFTGMNAYSDYTTARTLTFSDSAPNPGDTITCTVVGAAFAGTIDVGLLEGVAITPASANTTSCQITIPAYTEFDEAGTHIGTAFGQAVTVSLSDGVGDAATATIVITPDVSANFGVVGTGSVYGPDGTKEGDVCYVRVISGTGTASPESVDFTPVGADASVHFMVFDSDLQLWRARNEQTVSVPRTVSFSSTTVSVSETAEYSTADVGGPRFSYPISTATIAGVAAPIRGNNLLKASNNFSDPSWTKTRANPGATLDVTLDDGTVVTMTKLVEDGTASNTHVCSAINVPADCSKPHVFRCLVKSAGNSRRLRLIMDAGSSVYVFAHYDPDTGSVVTTSESGGADLLSATITLVGTTDGVYLCELIGTPGLAGDIELGLARLALVNGTNDSYSGDNASSVYIARAQLNEGTEATTYQETSSQALVDGDDISTSNWSATAILTRTPGQADWEGGTKANLIIPTTASSQHQMVQTLTAADYVDSSTVTWWVIAKAAGYSWIYFVVRNKADAYLGSNFNISTGALGTNAGSTSRSITDLGNGWYLCKVTVSIGAGATTPSARIYVEAADNTTTFAGDGTSGVQLSHPLLHAGTVPQAYANERRPRISGDGQRLTHSGDLSNAAHTKTRTTVSGTTHNATLDTGEVLTMQKVVQDGTAGATHFIFQNGDFLANTPGTFCVKVKLADAGFPYIRVGLSENSTGTNFAWARINLSTGVLDSAAGTLTVTDIDSLGDGVYLVTITGTPTVGAGNMRAQISLMIADGSSLTFNGDSASGCYAAEPILVAGTVAPSYSRSYADRLAPGGSTRDRAYVLIPHIDEFDAAGDHIGTRWDSDVEWAVSDGNSSATNTEQIAPPEASNFATVGDGPYQYSPTGAGPGDDAYVHVISGSGVITPSSFSFVPNEASTFRMMAYDVSALSWLAYVQTSRNVSGMGGSTSKNVIRNAVRYII